MSAATNGRVLRIALAASVAVHFVFAAIVHSQPVKAQPEQPPQRTFIIHYVPPTPHPTPTPPPPKPALPQPQKQSPVVHPPVRVPHLPPSTRRRGASVPPPVQATAEPEPAQTSGPIAAPTAGPVVVTPTPKPACSAPDVPAKTVFAQTPEVPEDGNTAGYTGTAKVKVDLSSSGAVTGVSIYESTGFIELDQAAMAAARASRYLPEQRNCKNVSGSYLFTIDFQ